MAEDANRHHLLGTVNRLLDVGGAGPDNQRLYATRLRRIIAIGLDLGSSSIKGAVLDLATQEIRSITCVPCPAPVPGLPPGHFEIAPQAVEAATRQVLDELVLQAPSPVGLFVSGQMGGVILVDDAGMPLTNYLSWRDQRTLAPFDNSGRNYLDAIRLRWDDRCFASLGSELQPGSLTALLFWLANHGALPPAGIPVSVADYVIGRLCGSTCAMQATQAIGLLDLEQRSFHRLAFSQLGLGEMKLPELLADLQPCGQARVGKEPVPVFGAYGDQQCALLGAGLMPGEISLNISTGSQVSRRVEQFVPGAYQTRMFFDGDLLNTITHLPAGRSLQVLLDLLTELARAEGVALRDPWGEVVRQASQATGTDLQVNLTFFAGPLGSRGSIEGITTENLTAGNLFYAALVQMADNYVRCADWLDPHRLASAVVLSGGLTKSVPLLKRLISSRFTPPIREARDEETLLGLKELASRVFRSGSQPRNSSTS